MTNISLWKTLRQVSCMRTFFPPPHPPLVRNFFWMTAKKCGVNNCNKSPQGLSSILEASEVKGQVCACVCVCVWTAVCHISAPGLGVKYAHIENLGKYFCPHVRARESVACQSIEAKSPSPRVRHSHAYCTCTHTGRPFLIFKTVEPLYWWIQSTITAHSCT